MTTVEDRLRLLLHEAAPPGDGVLFNEVAERVRHRRRRTLATTCALIAAVTTGSAFAVAALRASEREQPVVVGRPAVTVTFQGITFAVPRGWTYVNPPTCGSGTRNYTVVAGDPPASCAGSSGGSDQVAKTWVELNDLYGPYGSSGWTGQRTIWRGQPAWITERPFLRLVLETLTLPWANVTVTVLAEDRAKAQELLDRVSIRSFDGLAVPSTARSIDIGSSGAPAVTLTSRQSIERILDDLRSLTIVTAPERACDGTLRKTEIQLTVHGPSGDRTYWPRFGNCDQVVAGTGRAAQTNAQLLTDLRQFLRFFPGSGI